MLYELLQLIATGITLEKKRGDDWYEEPGCRNRFGKLFPPLLTEFDAVDVLENVESSIAGDDLNAKFQQAPQRSNRTAKILVVQSGVAEEGFGGISHGLCRIGSSNSLVIVLAAVLGRFNPTEYPPADSVEIRDEITPRGSRRLKLPAAFDDVG